MIKRTKSAGRRHRGRELALRVLFEIESNETINRDREATLDYQAKEIGATGDVYSFAQGLIVKCLNNAAYIDQVIGNTSTNWDIKELGRVERVVLRLGTAELLDPDDVPAPVAIDEAVELAKEYSGAEAAAFVNGVLGQIIKESVPDKL